MLDRNVLQKPAVVIDNGSGSCKAGISGKPTPQSILKSVVGHFEEDPKRCSIGKKALAQKGIRLTYPIERGVITHWDDMEKLWEHVYQEKLHLESSARPVLLSEPPLNPLRNREKMAELMFERFRVPAAYLAIQATLAVYASARITGLVVDSGEGVTHTVPIYDGHCLPHGVVRLGLAGKDITQRLAALLWKSRPSSLSRAQKKTAKHLKKELCYVALDPQQEAKAAAKEVVAKLPRGNSVKIDFPLHQGPEILFTPNTVGVDAPGLPTMVARSIAKCDGDICAQLYENLLLSGGSSRFPCLAERLFKDVEGLLPQGVSLRIKTVPESALAPWTGGSIITHLTSFEPMWLTREEYGDFGPTGIHRKCF